ncbi:MAG: DsbA family protein [Alphaproteobacteria bacterium]|nr:DsbA family protein [Alphaproteobacteria bacterium]MBT4019708.1 DsbA family protein [Alphaproteobacteria bacterium]MBT5160724.1 DsbA family protein [Alphaproteobacteria bacterium]MBT5920312.1 DsbA family protein [Alphaproteobacteria bacterium]MBT6386180.1 DsbA family protein [Alphaproteobacteria bacterium]
MFSTLLKSAFGLFLSALLLTAPAQAEEALTPAQKKAVEATIESYLIAHPEIIVQALQSMQEREKQAKENQVIGYLSNNGDRIRNDPNSFVGGNPDGDVTLVEFFDYRCGYCKKFHPVLEELLKTDKNLRVVYKEFPILGPESQLASQAAIAAMIQDPKLYLPFHVALMEARGSLTQERILDIAEEIGLDLGRLKGNLQANKIKEVVASNYDLAQNLGITGTPGFVIGDKIIPGYVNAQQMRSLIAEARTGCKTC